MRVLVTGASGFVGRHLVPSLLEHGHEVHTLTRAPSLLEKYSWAARITCHEGDLLNEQSLQAACLGCDVVIHLASLAHITNTKEEDHWNISYIGYENLLRACVQNQVSHFVFISSIKASDDKQASAYAQVKRSFELRLQGAAQKGEIQATILRPAVVYGAGMKGNLASWIAKVLTGSAPGLPKNSSSISMISVDDLAQAIACSLNSSTQNKGPFTIHDGQHYSMAELEEQIYQACQRKGPSIRLPRWCWWLAGKIGDFGFALTGRSIGFSSYSYDTLFGEDDRPDNNFAEATGFIAKQRFSDQLPMIVEELKKNH